MAAQEKVEMWGGVSCAWEELISETASKEASQDRRQRASLRFMLWVHTKLRWGQPSAGHVCCFQGTMERLSARLGTSVAT